MFTINDSKEDVIRNNTLNIIGQKQNRNDFEKIHNIFFSESMVQSPPL